MAVRRGAVERAVRRDVRALGELTDIQRSLAETSYTLAKTLDEGAGLATAAVARELRVTLVELGARRPSKPQEDSLDQRRARRAARGGAAG